MKFLTKFFRTKKKLETASESSTISSLAPKVLTKEEDIEKIQPYLDKLKETIDAEGVSNIALSGSYGSGKSTILKTFKEQHPEYEYLNISLAAFNQKEGELEKHEKEKLERLLEVSILQQIFYHVEPDKIPESRFKRIINRKWWQFVLLAVSFVIWVFSSIILIKYDYLDKINPDTWSVGKPFDWLALLFILISFSGIGFGTKLIIQLFSNSKINKVNIKGELELGEKDNKSVFNEHLEEILYFFERTRFNVIIIEDLDRFDNTDIFTKLREINILLNNSKLIEREINFVYAIGDKLFKDKKERVKFFEYIIPVIPFINSSNAREQLQVLINESGLEEGIFSREFMSDVITFIDDIDMRLLINIFHEFVIYRKALKPEFIKKPEELFAIIAYKNLEPEDFSKLNSRQGKLYNLIHNKKKYIRKFIDAINEHIRENEASIKEINEHHIEDEKELRMIYVHQILTKLPSISILEQPINTLLDDEGFQKVINAELTYNRFEHYNYQYRISESIKLGYQFSEIEKEVNNNLDYKTRLKLIKGKIDRQIHTLQSEIGELKAQKATIESWELKQIFEKVELNEFLEDFSNNTLLRSLIINGYINENYNDYISLFHEGSVTREDVIFEQNVKGGYLIEFAYRLYKLDGLLERIDTRYFSRESILNFDLVDYLGNNYQSHELHYNLIIELLSNSRERSIKFIDEYITNKDRPIDLFIKLLTKQWDNFFNYVTEEYNYQRDKIYEYLRLILTYADVEDILNQNHDVLIEMISLNSSFLSLVDTLDNKELENKVQTVLMELDIKFDTLENPTDGTIKLFEFVYQNNHYRINKENIFQMLEINIEQVDKEAFYTKNYSVIKSSSCKHLIEYIEKNIDDYVKNVYLNIESNTKEDENYLVELLNKKITTNNGKSIIDKTDVIISDVLSILDDDLLFYLIASNKIKAIWLNIHHLYYGYDDVLEDIVNFINISENAQELSNKPVPKDENEEGKMVYIEMWKDILVSPTLSTESFELILKAGNIGIKFFDFENTAKDRLEIMIKKKSFAFDVDVFNNLEEHHALGLTYLEEYKRFILQFEDSFKVEEQHLSLILKSKIYNISEINVILSKIDITSWQSHVFLSNLWTLLAYNKGLNINNQKIIEVISNYPIDIYNVRILNNNFARFNKEEIKSIIKILKDEEYHKYLSKYTSEGITLAHTSYNDMLLDLMMKDNYIGKKSRKTKKGYVIYKNKDTISL